MNKTSYELFHHTRAFPRWAKPSQTEIATARKKTLTPDGTVLWQIGEENGAVSDHVEMSGLQSSSIICYGKDRNGVLRINRHVTFPALRTLPDDTRGSFGYNFNGVGFTLQKNGRTLPFHPADVRLDGNVTLRGHCGAFLTEDAGAFTKACEYAENRLKGNHSPYPFEAYPEGNRAHLAAESVLFCRMITEGLFGLRVVGLRQLQIAPKSDCITISNLALFGETFAITAKTREVILTWNGQDYQASYGSVFDFITKKFI